MTNRRILLVDRSAMLRRIGGGILRREIVPCEVATADKAASAFESAALDRPDVIVLDYGLPDMRVEEVCDRFRVSEATAGVPVVLLYSNGADIRALQRRCVNIRAAVHKPFVPENLVQTVRDILDSPPGASIEAPPKGDFAVGLPEMIFIGHTGMTPLPALFRELESSAHTGVLRLSLRRHPAEVLFDSGRVLLCSTRDLALYCQDSTASIPHVDEAILDAARKTQRSEGTPFFLGLRDADLLCGAEAVNLVRDHGQRLFSRVWLHRECGFEFERLDALPGHAKGFPATPEPPDMWLLKTLRYLRPESVPAMSGVPVWCPKGKLRAEAIRWTAGERAFLAAMDGQRSLPEITSAATLEAPVANAILFRLDRMGFVGVWPK